MGPLLPDDGPRGARLRRRARGIAIEGVAFVALTLLFPLLLLAAVAVDLVLWVIRRKSIIDNALPDAVLGRAHDLGLRFVIKRELRALPTIDIGGRWVPTNFVRRRSGDTEGELEKLRTLAIDLQPDEGILIYPEGTRCTAEKLAHAQAIIAERQPEVGPLAARLRHVLPPRLGGTLALLEATR